MKKGILIPIPILVASVIALLLIICLQQRYIQSLTSDYIIGTYCTGDGTNESDEYFTFMLDNTYCQYQQFNVLERGSYEKERSRLYTLHNKENKEQTTQILCMGKNVYCFHKDGSITVYTKISNTPLSINVDIPDPQ